ncbi:MAG: hypothetical protein WA584_11810 [Pyrinomonadaceae bacterium]
MIFYLLIIVAFGATLFYISSRVRKAAGQAFESETIETDEFVIVKPEGFINPVNNESGYAFEAYSKNFGTGENAENMNQAEIFVSVFDDKSFNAVCEEAKTTGEILPDSDGKICLIKSEETLENVSAYKFYKIIGSENGKKVYELKISVLQDFLAEYQNRVDETLESFRLK